MELTHELSEHIFKQLPLSFKQHVIAVAGELDNACISHPEYPNGNYVFMSAIVAEECGELVKASIEYAVNNTGYYNMHNEAIQTAAMCFRMLLNLPNLKHYESAAKSKELQP